MTARLFLRIFGLEARKLMSYRVDFWLNSVFGFAVQLLVAWYLWRAIFAEAGRSVIGGYSFDAMVAYYVLVILIGRVVQGDILRGAFSTDIYDGGLTKYIVYPRSYFLFKYAQSLGSTVPSVVQLVALGLVAPLALDLDRMGVSGASLAMATVSLALANLLFILMVYPLQGVAFWADNVWTLNVLFRFSGALLGGWMLPLNLFPGPVRQVLEWLPFAALYGAPVETLLGRVGPAEWARQIALTLAWCLAIGLLGRVVWRRGALVYTGVGI